MEKPGSDIEHYVENLCTILENKRNQIGLLKQGLDDFKQHLLEEQILSMHCSERQQVGDEQDIEEGDEPDLDEIPRKDPNNKENSN